MMPVTRPAAGPDPVTEAARREAALQRIPFLFRRAGADVTMQALSRAMIDYQAEK